MSVYFIFSLLFPVLVVTALLGVYLLTGVSLFDFFSAFSDRGTKLTCWHCKKETLANRKTCQHCGKELQ